jgi:type II secretory pathway component PulM
MLKRLNDRERKMIIGTGIFLGIVVAYILFVGPFLKSKKDLSEKLDYSYQLYQEYQDILANETVYQEQLQARREEMLAISRLLLSGNTSSLAAAELSNKIRSYANAVGVSITREDQNNQPVVIDHHQQISIQLNMSCDIIALRDFLQKIEEDTNLLVINSLEINAPSSMRRAVQRNYRRKERNPTPENLRVNMTISGFIEGSEVPAGGGR